MNSEPQQQRLGLLRFGGILAAFALVAVIALIAGHGGHHAQTATIDSEPVPPAGEAAKPAPSAAQFGTNVNYLFNNRLYNRAQIAGQLATLKGTGATVARTDALWGAGEPSAPSGAVHHYDWAFDDVIAASLAQAHLQWQPILDYSTPWAQSVPGQDHSAPRSASDFAAWGAAFASRYGKGGSFWREHPTLSGPPVATYEVWNEPDNPDFWVPRPDPAYYASVYARTRDAIQAVDPSARVIIGGLENWDSFLPALLRARPDLAGHVDGVGIHPYGLQPFSVLVRVRDARRVLDRLGLSSVPLYVTEFGWATSPPGAHGYASTDARPGYIEQTISSLGHTDCDVVATILYTWVTPRHNRSDREDWFGIAPPDGGTSPDVAAFAQGIAKASAAAPVVPLCAG